MDWYQLASKLEPQKQVQVELALLARRQHGRGAAAQWLGQGPG